MPSWSVAPSGTSSATWAPIRRSTSPMTGLACSYGGTSTSTAEVDVVDVDEAVAERPRHRPVELDDDRLRGPDRRVHRLDARPERAEPVGVGRGRVDEHDVERQGAALEQPRHVGQEDRHVVGPALVDRGARVRPDEQRAMPEVPGHLRREVRPGTLGMEVDDADVVEAPGRDRPGPGAAPTASRPRNAGRRCRRIGRRRRPRTARRCAWTPWCPVMGRDRTCRPDPALVTFGPDGGSLEAPSLVA